MIKVNISQLDSSKNSFNTEIINGEKISSAVNRSLEGLVEEKLRTPENFICLLNGVVIGDKFWDVCNLKSQDIVVIAPKLRGDDSGGLLRTLALIATAAIVGPWAVAIAGEGITASLITAAAVTIVGALIPPPVPPGLKDRGLDSQMYTINEQGNNTRNYNTVPKVYGTHRIFPPFAAMPYTELETDPVTGQLIQFYYAIYDLGMGPMVVSTVQIGDTALHDFSDVSYRLVDFNRPAVSEGIWDDELYTDLAFYKGDINKNQVGVGINEDELPTNPESSYKVIRNASPNTLNANQELTVNLAFPSGLFSVSSKGENRQVIIDLLIEFSKADEDNWFLWNDITKVSSFKGVGGDVDYTSAAIDLLPKSSGWYTTFSTSFEFLDFGDLSATLARVEKSGIPKGATEIVLKYPGVSLINHILRIKGIQVGKIIDEQVYTDSNYRIYTFDTPLEANIQLFYTATADFDAYNHRYDDLSVNDKVTHESYTPGRARISSSHQGPYYADFRFTPIDIASYKVRITRQQTIRQGAQAADDMLWASLTTKFDESPINTDKRHTFLEIKIRATDQLNGSIQNLSAVVSSVLDIYNGSSWEKQITSNPAWVFVDMLTGQVNKRAISKDRLDIPSIIEWSEFCDEIPTPPPGKTNVFPRFSCNFVLDFNPTLQTAINMVTNASQASLNIIDGKYGILIDKLRTVPIQIFTPRNSSGFGSTRSYVEKPHALKVQYIDVGSDWEQREVVVYDSGYDATNATTFEDVTSFGCTNVEQAWRLGRYMLAQNRLRQETINIQVDFENLVCTRGDYVQITQDVMKAGGTPARVKSISGNRVVIDEGIDTTAGTYGFVYRARTGEIYTNTLSIVSADTFDLDGPNLPLAGDLIVIGIMGQIVFDCLVKSIDPQDDLKATIILVEKADAIYEAESTDTFPPYNPQISTTASVSFTPPGEVVDLRVTDSFYECQAGGPSLDYFITLDWDVPTNAATDVFEVYVDTGSGFNLVDFTKESLYTYKVNRDNLDIEHKFKVLAVSATGRKLQLPTVGLVSSTPGAKTTPPPNIELFNADITGEVLQLFWTLVDDCATKEYLIRYSPVVINATWERSIPLSKVNRNTTLVSVQARTGTYFIKAIDYEDNESLAATSIVTTIPGLFGLNVVAETSDFPALPGVLDRVVEDTGGLTLDNIVVGGVDTAEYYSEGFYYYQNLLDLGDIYTVRLQSLIQAEGFTLDDLMVNWTTLTDLVTMSHAGNSDWDVETYYRTTDAYNIMAEWPDMSSIDPISEGNQDLWSPWRKFTIGDATGRVFEFRLRLISNKVNVTPRVFDGTIKADMPDRTASFNDISAPSGGVLVEYDPAFYGPGTSPAIAISMQSAQSGDYWAFDYRTLEGFYIRFFDSGDNPVSRSFDAQVKGFGSRALAVI